MHKCECCQRCSGITSKALPGYSRCAQALVLLRRSASRFSRGVVKWPRRHRLNVRWQERHHRPWA
eukprot:520645-Alexandrium_andersonii.AAC.1